MNYWEQIALGSVISGAIGFFGVLALDGYLGEFFSRDNWLWAQAVAPASESQ